MVDREALNRTFTE